MCMGWQGFSWSSVDYGGNWKLLHYSVRKMFKPILVSGELILCLLHYVDGPTDNPHVHIRHSVEESRGGWSTLQPT